MVTEDYVSFETAKLLKEKGFDEECACFYSGYDYGVPGLEYDSSITCINSWLDDEEYAAPTLQMAMKWLRDIFHLEIYPFHDAIQENNDWWYRIERHSKGCGLTEHESDVIYKTYEEACEAAIKFCLEYLI